MSKSSHEVRSSAPQPNILSLIDFCKGLAIAAIVLFHFNSSWFGWQGVHVFLVLSGFGLTYSCLKKGNDIAWKQWYLKRFERIFPAYWLICLCMFLMMSVLNILYKNDLIKGTLWSAIDLILDVLLLRNFSMSTIFPVYNDPLWFVPFVIGFYLIFPFLYQLIVRYSTLKGHLIVLLGVVIAEFAYRAVAIYWLDGYPIGFENPLLGDLSLQPLESLDRLPDSFPFQLQVPFAFFPARIAEFFLGMLAASALLKNPKLLSTLFAYSRIGIVGFIIWIAGFSLVFIGLREWIFADLFISLGLVLWVVNLAWICQQKFSFLFVKLSQIGQWSYYIFLTHGAFIFLQWQLEGQNIHIALPVMLGGIVFGTWITSWLVMKFDQSGFPKLIVKQTFAKLLS